MEQGRSGSSSGFVKTGPKKLRAEMVKPGYKIVRMLILLFQNHFLYLDTYQDPMMGRISLQPK